MILALAATERALDRVRAETGDAFVLDERTALVFGSSYGEIETTKDFLVTLADLRMARPLLFQNSLHNSTAGFLTQHLKMTGPALTVSSESVTGEESLNAALTLLRSGVADRAVVTVTDSIPADLLPAFRALRGADVGGPFEFGDGSASIVLERERDPDGENLPEKTPGSAIAYFPGRFETTGTFGPDETAEIVDENYKADAVHLIVRALEAHPTESRTLLRARRDGGRSRLRWTRG